MKDYFGYAPALVVPRIVSALILVVFSRMISPEEVGLYALVIIIGEYLDTVFCRWIRSGYTRLYFTFRERGESIDRAVIILVMMGLIISIPCAFAYAELSENLDMRWAALLCLYTVSNFILYQGLQFLRVRGMRTYYTIIEIGRSSIGFLFALALTSAFSFNYEWLIIGTQSLTFIAAGWLLIRMLATDGGGRFDRNFMKQIWDYSGPLIFVYFLSGTTLVIDRFMLERLGGPSLLGVYAVSYQMSRPIIDIIFNIINVGGFPKLVSAYEADGDIGAQKVLYQKSIAIALVSFPVLGFILVASDQISEIILKDEFAMYAPLTMSIIAISSFLRGWVRFCVDQIFLLRRTTFDQVWNLLPSIAVTAMFALVFIPPYGVYGAASSVLAGSMTEAVFAVRRARRRMWFRIFGREIWIILGSSFVGAVAISIWANTFGFVGLTVGAGVVLIIYGVAMKKFGILGALKS